MADSTAKNSNPGGFKKDDPRINREGRPKGSVSVVVAIKKKLEECPEGKEKTYLHYLVEKIMKKAIIDDDVNMIRDIIDRVDGKPKQPLIGGDEEDKPIKIEISDSEISKIAKSYANKLGDS
jgi:hypothetical protein